MQTRISMKLIRIIAILLPLLWVQPLFAQSQPFVVEIDRSEISMGELLSLSVTISGSTHQAPLLPQLDGLSRVGSSTTSHRSIVNGQVTTRVIYQFWLQPTQIGEATIGAITASVDGRVHVSQPFSITVTPDSGQPQLSTPQVQDQSGNELTGQDYFVEAEVSNPNPYVGQQVDYIFRFYRALPPFFQPNFRAPTFNGFWSDQQVEQRQYQVDAARREYSVTELRTILFPTIVGPIAIEPAVINIPGGLFDPGISVRTEEVTIDARPLPLNAPDDFNGAIGQFIIDAELDDTTGVVNEPVTLKVTLYGQGNINTLPNPVWPDQPGWRTFDSTSKTETSVVDGLLTGARTYERLLVPTEPGSFTILPINYTFFDPIAEEYRSTTTDPIAITIEPGAEEAPLLPVVTSNNEDNAFELLAIDIRHIKPVPSNLIVADPPLTTQAGYWGAWGTLMLALVGSIVWQRRQQGLRGDISLMRSRQALKNARKMLKQARNTQSDTYVAAGQTLTAYLNDKFDQPVAGLTHSALADLLASRGVDSPLVERVQDCLSISEGGRYSPRGAASTSEELLDRTESIITDLEKDLSRES